MNPLDAIVLTGDTQQTRSCPADALAATGSVYSSPRLALAAISTGWLKLNDERSMTVRRQTVRQEIHG
jgi:hypothetical protein